VGKTSRSIRRALMEHRGPAAGSQTTCFQTIQIRRELFYAMVSQAWL